MSLQETYQSRKDLIAENLIEKGIEANGNEGLTTLANKILEITATEPLETVVIAVEFDDSDNQDGVRPEGISGSLLINNGTYANFTLNSQNSWSVTLSDVPEGTYSVNMPNVSQYTKTDISNGNFFKYTYAHEPITLNAQARVVFNDNNDGRGVRPESIKLYLFKNNEVYTSQTVSAATAWKHTFTHLPMYSNPTKAIGGQSVNTYAVQCTTVPNYYNYSATGNSSDGFVQTFSIQNSDLTIRVSFDFDDEGLDYGNATFKITGPDPSMPMTITYSQFTNGIYELSDLFPGVYGVICTNAFSLVEDGMVGSMSEIATIVTLADGGSSTASLYLQYISIAPEEEPEEQTMDIPVTIVWDDNDNADLNRPESVTVRLYSGGAETDSAIITANDGWVHTFEDKLRYADDGHAINYSINEDPVDWYNADKSGFTIRNVYQPEVTALAVRKVWDDNNNELGYRPSSIAMTLYNENQTKGTVLLNEANGWTATISSLPTRINGEPVTYTWKEQEILSYIQQNKVTDGTVTTFTNAVWVRPENPERPPKTP